MVFLSERVLHMYMLTPSFYMQRIKPGVIYFLETLFVTFSPHTLFYEYQLSQHACIKVHYKYLSVMIDKTTIDKLAN